MKAATGVTNTGAVAANIPLLLIMKTTKLHYVIITGKMLG